MKILVFLNEEDNNAKTKDILWGGATASSQYEGGYKEGGKGLDTQNCRPYLRCYNIYKTTHTRYY